jgi:beta-lactamase class A
MKRIIAIGLLSTVIFSGVAMKSPHIAMRSGSDCLSLRDTFEKIAADARGQAGISLFQLETIEHISVNGHRHFAMQSVFKFPLALCILDAVDKGRFSLAQKIHIAGADWVQKTWSPMRDQYKSREIDISLLDLLSFTVSSSDNIACDVLFRLIGGTRVVNDYVHGLGIRNMEIAATEAQMHAGWNVQYKNWCTPDAMSALFELFYKGGHLSTTSTRLLMDLMTGTTTGAARIKGLLPPGASVAHKTGSGDTNPEGITAATNDAGIITLPDGRHLILVVLVGDSRADDSTRERVIARIAKVAFDYYVHSGSSGTPTR